MTERRSEARRTGGSRRDFLGLLGLGGVAAALLAARVAAGGERISFGNATVELVTASGRHALDVEVADTPEARARGLMYRRTLARGKGMLFDFKTPRVVAMWMKNTVISLDMVFVAIDGTVVDVVRGAKPGSLDTIYSSAPALAVIEVAAGEAERLGVAPGDRAIHPIFAGGLPAR